MVVQLPVARPVGGVMKAIFRLCVFVLLAGGWTLAALSLHVVRTKAQFPITLLTKNHLSFKETWVDTTTWTIDDVAKHPVVVERIIRTRHADALKHLADPRYGDLEQQLSDALERAARSNDPAPEQLARRWLRWPWDERNPS
jgi:hypothetical protein